MTRAAGSLAALLSITVMVSGVLVIEDAVFNRGAMDTRELFIGTCFLLVSQLALLLLSLHHLRPGQKNVAILACLPILLYLDSTWPRWQVHSYFTYVDPVRDSVPAHVLSTGEWLMINPAMLRQEPHWYETGLKVTYLENGGKNASEANLPAKYLSLKKIKAD